MRDTNAVEKLRMRSTARRGVHLARLGRRTKPYACLNPAQRQGTCQFHKSVGLTSESRRSGGQNDHQNPLDRNDNEHIRSKATLATSERASENTESQSAVDSPSVRKTLRQRRNAPEIPKPPPIPDWFLRHNVQLSAGAQDPDPSYGTDLVFHEHKRDQAGRVLLTFPHYVDDGIETQQLQSKSPSKPDDAVPSTPDRDVHTKSGLSERDVKADSKEPKVSTVDSAFFTSKATPKASEYPGPDFLEPKPRSFPELLRGTRNSFESLSYVLLEIEASVRAAYALVGREHHVPSPSNIDLSLLCPDQGFSVYLDVIVEGLAKATDADLIRLDANDFADLTDEYIGNGVNSPGWFSTLGYDVFDGIVASGSSPVRLTQEEHDDANEDDAEDNRKTPSIDLESLKKALYDKRHEIAKALDGIPIQHISLGLLPGTALTNSQSSSDHTSQVAQHTSNSDAWDPARLRVLLDGLLEAPSLARDRDSGDGHLKMKPRVFPSIHSFRGLTGIAGGGLQEISNTMIKLGCWSSVLASQLRDHILTFYERAHFARLQLSYQPTRLTPPGRPKQSRRTIVHIRDLSDLCRTDIGLSIVRHFIRMIQRRRKLGEEILLVGTSAQDVIGPIANGQEETDDLPLRHLIVPPYVRVRAREDVKLQLPQVGAASSEWACARILEINLRHIQSALRRLRPADQIDLFSESSQKLLTLPGSNILGERVLPLDCVQRIVVTAIGLSRKYAMSDTIHAVHVALSTTIINRVDASIRAWSALITGDLKRGTTRSTEAKQDSISKAENIRSRMEDLKKICNPHETRLLSGVADPDQIKTGFDEVHAPEETIDALRTLTSLSLLRPDAFKYGVLAKDRLTGLMLYGPPGTGKTLLAKAVAKEAKATVLEISGAQIYEKYVGEGEKMVRAVFTLAKKLSPCIVFLDEADAIFSSRGETSSRNTHRQIINQFLREWDGMDSHEVFVMVASNRPFDLDDAVLRRLPRRLLVDLPVAKDRESILGIHLRDEQLDESVSVASLAEKTPFYSGSDLKNLCVAAALACVTEENRSMTDAKGDEAFKLPEKRILSSRHFDQAIREVSASISEDMSSLAAIRKFDEQYGDRRGRRKKNEYGFGTGTQESVNEDSARVRQDTPPRP